MNDAFCRGNQLSMFVTVFAANYDFKSRRLEYCNGGHNPILIVEPDGKAYYLHAKSNLAVGLFEGFKYEKEELELKPGTRLVLYTDGVTEAENASKDQYGEQRLKGFAESLPVDTSSEIFVSRLMESINAFTDGNEQNDDITILSIKL